MRKILFSICLLLSSLYHSLAQTSEPTLINPTPPSPNAASLSRYGDVPVSTYTGVPNVNIPLYEIDHSGYKLPISLSYNAGGMKVEEIASFVGLGWSLNAGGVITRTVYGRDDLGGNGFISSTGPIPENLPHSREFTHEQAVLLNRYATQYEDGEPDVFFFNFAGKTGKFVLDRSGVAHIIPHQKIKIERLEDPVAWIITTEDGVKFRFGTAEHHQSKNFTSTNGNVSSSDLRQFISSWYLDTISLPNSDKPISFEYQIDEDTLTQWVTGNNESKKYETNNQDVVQHVSSFTRNWVKTVHPMRINFNGGVVEFILGKQRIDLEGDKVLKEIKISDHKLAVVKILSLKYNYNNKPSWDIETFKPIYPDHHYRLFLYSITELDGRSINRKPPYLFKYVEGSLPSRNSFDQDWWGFYNGASNSSLIPDRMISLNRFTDLGTVRNPDFQKAKIGSLFSIQYPTGGYTTFEYEPHYLGPRASLPNKIVKREKSLPIDIMYRNVPKYLESDTFKINSPAFAKFELPSSNTGACENCKYFKWRLLKQKTDGTFEEIWVAYDNYAPAGAGEQVVYQGIYKLSHEILIDTASYYRAIKYGYSLTVRWSESIEAGLTEAGGLRIANIIDYDPVNKKKISKVYEYKESSGNSSGYLVSHPKAPEYLYEIQSIAAVGGILGEIKIRQFLVLLSTYNLPLSTTQGSYIGYSEVSIYTGIESLNDAKKSNGKITYKYTSPAEIRDILPTKSGNPEGNPFPNIISQDWKRGLLKEEIAYQYRNNTFVEVKRTNNYYTFWDYNNPNSNTSSVLGFKAGVARTTTLPDGTEILYAGWTFFDWGYYRYVSGSYSLDSTIEKTFDPNNIANSIESKTKYKYNLKNLQISEKRVINSANGKNMVSLFFYPPDYVNDTVNFIRNLVANNIISVPIEQVSYLENLDGSNKQVIDGQIHRYTSTGDGLLSEIYSLDIASPISAQAFKFSNLELGSVPPAVFPKAFVYDSRYAKRVRYDYNPDKTLNQIMKDNVVAKSFLWGYNGTLPVAEVGNSVAAHIFHTSFEESGVELKNASGNNIAKTGTRVNNGSFSFPSTFNPPAGSVMSYWSYNGTSWTYSGEVAFSRTISTTLKLDEIRVYPRGSLMTTYTHAPLIGVTSVTDPNGVSMYYDYDSSGRLEFIRDTNGKVIKSYLYNYRVE